MTPAEKAKAAGLPSLNYVIEKTGVSRTTLCTWAKDKPALFGIVVRGCILTKVIENDEGIVKP